jgi:hypothetical protein
MLGGLLLAQPLFGLLLRSGSTPCSKAAGWLPVTLGVFYQLGRVLQRHATQAAAVVVHGPQRSQVPAQALAQGAG